ncbi:MAG TPA: ATP-binding protein, partial [Rugosimonospora sp.]|nr:ATP-binding protein [Rugosimonospora sp.]
MGNSSTSLPWLAGRDAEQSAISALLAAAAAGDGGALILHGPPGLGKTALLEWAAAAAGGAIWLRGQETEAGVAFAALHRLLHATRPLSEPLLHSLEQCGREQCGPEQCGPEQGPDRPLALRVGALDVLCRLSQKRAVLCCVDDAQWLDEPSWGVVAFVARRLQGTRVAVLITAEAPDRPVAGIPEYPLGPLDHRASLAVLAGLVPAGDVAGVLAHAAEGNPQALLDLAGGLSVPQRRGEAPAPATLP